MIVFPFLDLKVQLHTTKCHQIYYKYRVYWASLSHEELGWCGDVALSRVMNEGHCLTMPGANQYCLLKH